MEIVQFNADRHTKNAPWHTNLEIYQVTYKQMKNKCVKHNFFCKITIKVARFVLRTKYNWLDVIEKSVCPLLDIKEMFCPPWSTPKKVFDPP